MMLTVNEMVNEIIGLMEEYECGMILETRPNEFLINSMFCDRCSLNDNTVYFEFSDIIGQEVKIDVGGIQKVNKINDSSYEIITGECVCTLHIYVE